MVDIRVFNQQKDLSIAARSVKTVVNEVLINENFVTHELSVYFVTPLKSSQLHAQFFNDPTPTDTISVPIDGPSQEEEYHVLGELFICPHMAISYLENRSIVPTPDHLYGEMTLYLVHALLHLLGYDDIKIEDRKKMRQAEKRHLETLRVKELLLAPNKGNR